MTRTVRLKKTKEINLLAVFNIDDSAVVDSLQSNKFLVSWTMYVEKYPDSDITDISIKQNVSYQKILHFLDNYVNDSLWYDPECIPCIDRNFSSAKNFLFITPTVNLTCLSNVLFRKFNALCSDNVFVDSIEIYDFETDLNYEYFNDTKEYDDLNLPTAKEFVGEYSIYDNPWWERSSISTYDYAVKTEQDLLDIRKELEESEKLMEKDLKVIEEEVIKQFKKTYNVETAKGELIKVDFTSKTKTPKKLD